ncbi:type IV conjugative transfer system coupling protein TraD [Burkholderia gladioli]|uniref:type IV conjugative transfer system coupling protein TraD n=1 Tax=Burkholderia gladioli TaxID=28095 RepID=UPI00163FDAD9|nr:type IV conjugative transfer system coupling protein TraD [Burkholderia gladioli]
MSRNQVLENRFRKPYELLAATSWTVGGVVMASLPGWMLATQTGAYCASGAAFSMAAIRFHQGRKILRYRRNLRRLRLYAIEAQATPWSRKRLFMGRGFRWEAVHAQRLYELSLSHNAALLKPGWIYDWARWAEARFEHTSLAWLEGITSRDVWWNPARPLPPVQGSAELHGLELAERDIWTPLGERVGHMVVLGTTRVGKTRFAEILITQDIHRGDIVIVIDPKGDAALLKRMYAEAARAGRLDQFHVFHLGFPELSARYNAVGSFGRVTEVASRTAGPLPSEGQSATFKQFVWRFVNVMARAMISLGEKPTYESIYRNAVSIDSLALRYFEQLLDARVTGWRDDEDGPSALAGSDEAKNLIRKTGRSPSILSVSLYIRRKGIDDMVANALISVIENDRTYFDKLVSSLYPLLEKLTTGEISALLSPDYNDASDKRPILDWMNVINSGGVVYVGLDALTDAEVAAAVGNAMFADLTSTAGKIYKHGQTYGQSSDRPRRKLSIHADEFNELIGDEFVPLLNKSGGADYQVTVYTQTWQDVEAKIGNRAKADQIGGNLNSMVMLRVKNLATARLLTDQLPEVDITTRTLDSGARDAAMNGMTTDFNEFTSSTQDRLQVTRRPLLEPASLFQLPKGQAFALLEGGRLYKLRLPLLSDVNDPYMPDHLVTMANRMRDKYNDYLQQEDSDDEADLLTVEGSGSGFD